MNYDWRAEITAQHCIDALEKLAAEDAGAYCRGELTMVFGYLRYSQETMLHPRKNLPDQLPILKSRFEINQKVRLRSGGTPGFGGLNGIFLTEEGYHTGDYVNVIQVYGKFAKVLLPSGRELEITAKDVY